MYDSKKPGRVSITSMTNTGCNAATTGNLMRDDGRGLDYPAQFYIP